MKFWERNINKEVVEPVTEFENVSRETLEPTIQEFETKEIDINLEWLKAPRVDKPIEEYQSSPLNLSNDEKGCYLARCIDGLLGGFDYALVDGLRWLVMTITEKRMEKKNDV